MWKDLTDEQKGSIITRVNKISDVICACEDCRTITEEIARTAVEMLPSLAPQRVPWDPRDGWLSIEQITAWQSGNDCGWLSSYGVGKFYPSYSPDGAFRWCWWRGIGLSIRSSEDPDGPKALIPTRNGHPVSWAEVDVAVSEMGSKDV